jgi:tight adherence protein C
VLLILAFVCFATALAVVGGALTQPRRERQASVRRAQAYGGPNVGFDDDPLVGQFNARYGGRLAGFAGRLDPRATPDRVGTKLVSAGLARTFSPTEFLALKVVLAAAGVIVGGLIGVLGGSATKALLLAAAFAATGFLFPDVIVTSRIRRRREAIRRRLPDALDVLAVSVEAGLGFDAALAKLAEYLDGPLVEEFTLVLSELRIGETRANALRKMADRVAVPELSSVVNSLIQAEQLGSPLGKMLRVQAQESRNRRQVAADEQAMKAPVKMIVPTALLIFPAMFIVILMPAVIAFKTVF